MLLILYVCFSKKMHRAGPVVFTAGLPTLTSVLSIHHLLCQARRAGRAGLEFIGFRFLLGPRLCHRRDPVLMGQSLSPGRTVDPALLSSAIPSLPRGSPNIHRRAKNKYCGFFPLTQTHYVMQAEQLIIIFLSGRY